MLPKALYRVLLKAKVDLTYPDGVAANESMSVLAAAKRVSARYGIKTDAANLSLAIEAASSQAEYAAAFQNAGIGILNTKRVRRYQAKRLTPTLWERLTAFLTKVYRGRLMHGWTGTLSAWLGLFATVPLIASVPVWMLFGEAPYRVSWFILILVQAFTLAVISIRARGDWDAEGKERSEAFDRKAGKIYAGVNAALICLMPTILCFWFCNPATTSRYWRDRRYWSNLPIKDFQPKLPYSAVITIDQVTTALPDALIELEVLEPQPESGQPEFFVTMPLAGTGENLYLWYEPAAA